MKENVLLKCGHIAQGVNSKNMPVCIICDCCEIADKPDLKNRIAYCTDCHREAKSSYALPFFKYNKSKNHDEYYCGCEGWD